jgi:hypothetical protein
VYLFVEAYKLNSMKAPSIAFPLLILAVIAVSGCVSPAASGNGMAILTFEPSFDTVFSGEPVDFRLRVQNTGTVEATDVTPKIIGLETWILDTDQCDGWDSISAAEPDINAPGETANCRWTYIAPDVPRGLSTKQSVTTRLYYGYRTSVVKSITLASTKELLLMKDRGQSAPVQTTSQTTSPLQIDIKTEAPVRVWEGSVTFPIAITVNNVGGGVACSSAYECKSNNNINKLFLDIKPGSDISIAECAPEIELWQGKTNTLVCQATFSGLRDSGLIQKTLTINTEYGYYIDKDTEITITSR